MGWLVVQDAQRITANPLLPFGSLRPAVVILISHFRKRFILGFGLEYIQHLPAQGVEDEDGLGFINCKHSFTDDRFLRFLRAVVQASKELGVHVSHDGYVSVADGSHAVLAGAYQVSDYIIQFFKFLSSH